jgi:hypothetical protein
MGLFILWGTHRFSYCEIVHRSPNRCCGGVLRCCSREYFLNHWWQKYVCLKFSQNLGQNRLSDKTAGHSFQTFTINIPTKPPYSYSRDFCLLTPRLHGPYKRRCTRLGGTFAIQLGLAALCVASVIQFCGRPPDFPIARIKAFRITHRILSPGLGYNGRLLSPGNLSGR